jgi:hypothetical protein
MPNSMQTAKASDGLKPAERFFRPIKLPVFACSLILVVAVCTGGGSNSLHSAGVQRLSSGKANAFAGQKKTSAPSPSPSVLGRTVSPYSTAEEAALIAYKEAVKWNPDAVLAYISPDSSFLDFDFLNTGLATRWGAEFANRKDDSQLFIHIVCRKVDYTKDLGNKRRLPLNTGLKADRPAVSCEQAVKVALENGAPKGMLPVGVYFRIEPDAGKTPTDPRWLLSFMFDLGKGLSEYHFYAVNALTGMLYQPATGYVQQPGSNRLNINQLKYKPGYVAPYDEEQAIRKFYGLINRRSFDEAFKMMNPSMIAGMGVREMWQSTYDKIDSLDVRRVALNSPGTDGSLVCMVTYVATGTKENAQSIGLEVWPAANTRFVTLKKSGKEFLIQEIATGR